MKKTFTIAIYDDNAASIKLLQNIIDRILAANGAQARYRLFKEYGDLTEILEGGEFSCDLFFMDIELDGGLSGIELADRLTAFYDSLKIIFVTGYGSRYSQDIFTCSNALKPSGFLTKPFDDEVIEKIIMLKLFSQKGSGGDSVEIMCERRKITLDCRRIVFIESDGRKLKFHLKDGQTLDTYGKISSFLQLLPDCFLQSHRSYIVNIEMIKSIDSKEGIIHLAGNKRAFIAKTMKKDFMRRFLCARGGL